MVITQIALLKENNERIFENKFVSIFAIVKDEKINMNKLAKSVESAYKDNKNVIVILVDPNQLFTKDPDYFDNTKIIVIEFK